MLKILVSFAAGMAVMYLLNAIRWRRLRKWVQAQSAKYSNRYHRWKKHRRRSKH